MKKIINYSVFAVFSSVLLFSSCSKIMEALFAAFAADGANFVFEVPAFSLTDTTLTLSVQSVYFNLDSTVKSVTNNKYSINDVSNVNPDELSLKINNPDSNNNFSNFESGSVMLLSNSNSTPISFTFTKANVYSDSISVPLDKNLNLKTYLQGTNFTYTLSGKLRKATTKTLEIKTNMKFKISN